MAIRVATALPSSSSDCCAKGILPKSPCAHSAACTKCAGQPVDASDAAKRRATAPDFPIPVTKHIAPAARLAAIDADASRSEDTSASSQTSAEAVAASALNESAIAASITLAASPSSLPPPPSTAASSFSSTAAGRASAAASPSNSSTRRLPAPPNGGRPPRTSQHAAPAQFATCKHCLSDGSSHALAIPSAALPFPRRHRAANNPPMKASPAPVLSTMLMFASGGGNETLAPPAAARAPPELPAVTATSWTLVTA